ncbi:uncharacterized protein PHACADRAFT_263998 [Phanerochaete carnosa HHB-10118-sp]|uniref:Iminophenyl-pyruvate dimer synthase domain-containing protein n=1 Tax=Phanerochaete carnosa (strain HHB-10118-sp) TaxID=650164 RepID=K5VVM1_PHACS|nr:uncharacterized protein PHACADRAFT_263998 [Phanerochaete carnosa HHB-10118-sp]EKM50629.1 hypothetical protein PHACADRAFT_263998 [Phanerochaete carnosa HHB-10118-sp]
MSAHSAPQAADSVDASKYNGPVERAPSTWTKADLIAHVKTGMQVELGTLPIYFCALYSIHPDDGQWGTKARSNIMAVAEQEMLHLSLAGNMLRALDGTQKLYDNNFMPTYPSQILFDKVDMKLQPANKENLECFLKIEAPYMKPPELPPPDGLAVRIAVLPGYNSIGEFYKELEHGIRALCKDGQNPFTSNPEQQFRGDDFFDSKMTVVRDERTALEALETIVDQGEGSIAVPESHYAIFVELYQMQTEWTCTAYVDEPSTAKYTGHDVAYNLSLALNASYCYLLQTIDTYWTQAGLDAPRRAQVLRNIHRIMVAVLSPTAHVLVKQEITPGRFAAPCFEFFPPADPNKPDAPPQPISPDALYQGIQAHLTSARDAATDAALKAEIGKVLFNTNGLGPA